jgi:hypothetical protein
MASLESRWSIVFARESIFDSKMSKEGVGPEFFIKVCAVEHGAKSVANRLMGTFDGSVLMRAVCAGGTDFVSKTGKERADLGIVVELTALIEHNVLASNARRVAEEPVLEPGQRRTLGNTGSAIELGRCMVRNQDVAGFAVDACVGIGSSCVLRSLSGECKVDGQALPWNGG